MAWRSNHQAVYPDPPIPFSSPACPSLSCAASTGARYSSPTKPFFHPAPPISIPHSLAKKVQARASKNDEVKGWLDGMKAQSPPRASKNNKVKGWLDGMKAQSPPRASKNNEVKGWLDGMKAQSPPRASKNDEVRGWLDGMKAQSPPRFEALTGGVLDADAQEAAAAAQYAAWTVDHPSALETFGELMGLAAAGKQIAVFLDYDGTLSPIVEDPDRAYMSDLMRATVKEVATHFPTAIISGRGREKVYDFVQLAELYYAGSHGMDIMGPAEDCNGFKAAGTRSKDKKGNDVVLFQPASKFLPVMDQVCKTLEEKARRVPGAKVEHNTYCVTLHFRRVKEESWPELAEHVEGILKNYPELQLTLGRKVLEIRPAIAWDKGKAVGFLLKALGLENSRDVLPVYLGDDRTDEDAFVVMNEKSQGCSILVSSVAKSTNALYSLRDPSEVMEFLKSLVRWRISHPLKRVEPGRG